MGNQNPIQPRLLKISEAADYLGMAVGTLRNRVAPKAQDPFPVKPKRIGKRVYFDIRDLDRFIDNI